MRREETEGHEKTRGEERRREDERRGEETRGEQKSREDRVDERRREAEMREDEKTSQCVLRDHRSSISQEKQGKANPSHAKQPPGSNKLAKGLSKPAYSNPLYRDQLHFVH